MILILCHVHVAAFTYTVGPVYMITIITSSFNFLTMRRATKMCELYSVFFISYTIEVMLNAELTLKVFIP